MEGKIVPPHSVFIQFDEETLLQRYAARDYLQKYAKGKIEVVPEESTPLGPSGCRALRAEIPEYFDIEQLITVLDAHVKNYRTRQNVRHTPKPPIERLNVDSEYL